MNSRELGERTLIKSLLEGDIMRKIITYIFMASVVFAIVYMMVDKTTEIEIKFDGITYQIGADYPEVNPSTFEFKGTKRVNLFQRYWYYGTVLIDNEEYFLDYYSGTKTINLLHIPDGYGYSGYIGYIFMDKDFKELSIVKLEDGQWSSDGGVMLTFPCKSKEEAFNINKALMSQPSESSLASLFSLRH